MNQVVLNLINTVSAKPAASGSGTAAAPVPVDPDLFRATLNASVATAAVRPPAPVASSASALNELEAKLATMLDAGASTSDVAASLASELATSVMQKLGISGADARSKLEAVFAQALAPPGDGRDATTSVATRARTLAQRAVGLARTASTITDQTGQQKRIAGTISDAQKAKDAPARTTSDLSGINVLALPSGGVATMPQAGDLAPSAPASPAAAPDAAGVGAPADNLLGSTLATQAAHVAAAGTAIASGAATATAAAAAAGSGLTVDLDGKAALSSGGDTTLGRILARAAKAADARDAASGSTSPSTSPATSTTASPSTSTTASSSAVAAGTDKLKSDTAVDAFLKSFTVALDGGAESAKAVVHAASAQAGAAGPVASTPTTLLPNADSPGAFVPSVAPFAITRAESAEAPPAAAPVDPTAIADQLLRGAFLRNTSQSSEIRLSLVPENLGDVSVKLMVDAAGVTAHVIAQTPEARDALIAAGPQLTKSLAEAGLKLNGFAVDLSGNGFAGFAGQQQADANAQQRSPSRSASGGDLDEDDTLVVDAVPSFEPPTAAAPGVGDYNYLA